MTESPWLQRLRADAVRAVQHEGETVEAAAELLHLDPDTVREWCQEAGVVTTAAKRTYRVHDPAIRADAIARVRAGESQSSVARALDVSQQLVSAWCYKHGVASAQRGRQAPEYVAVLHKGKVYDRAALREDKVQLRMAGPRFREMVAWSEIEAWAPRASRFAPATGYWQDGPAAQRAA